MIRGEYDSSHIPSRLTKLGDVPRVPGDVAWAVYGCECGSIVRKRVKDVRRRAIRSCGCLRRELVAEHSVTHGHSCNRTHSPEFRVWAAMLARCSNPQNGHFKYYGGKGVRVVERWHDFSNFFADMGRRPRGKSIDRIDNDGPYSPENCRWATSKEQSRNRSDNKIVDWSGRKWVLVDLCDHVGLPFGVVQSRLNRYGWPIDRAVTTPVRLLLRKQEPMHA